MQGLASVLFCLAVFADNACLGIVNASFFQVARALTLPFVTFMGAVGARALPPRDLLLPCVLCVVGFSLGVHSQTPEAFADGTSMGVMASLLTAAYTRLLARAGGCVGLNLCGFSSFSFLPRVVGSFCGGFS